MNKCTKCGKKDLLEQLNCPEEECPYDPGMPARSPSEAEDLPVLSGDDEFIDGEPLFPDEEFFITGVELPPEIFSEPAQSEPKRQPKQIKLPNGKLITLNSQQEEALELMYTWQDDKTDLFFVLSGYAGTGKTTIVKEALKRWANRSPFGFSSVGVTAPTHKAKKVIADATGIQSNTIQSLLGLSPNVELADFDINKPEFAQKKKPSIEYYKFLVLDEGSMINKDLWKMLKEQCKRYNVKLIVMGKQILPSLNLFNCWKLLKIY